MSRMMLPSTTLAVLLLPGAALAQDAAAPAPTGPEIASPELTEVARFEHTLIQDDCLRWPDTFSQGPDGAIYVTTSHIMDMVWYRPENPSQLETQLWRFDPEG